MNKLAPLALGVLIAAGAAAPLLAQDLRQTPGSHITVFSCDAHRHRVGTPGHAWIDPYGIYHPGYNFPYTVGFLGIGYQNDDAKTAREIEFGLVARGSLIAVAKDAGTFSRGARIEHEFSVDPEIFPIGTGLPFCTVLYVKYADGSEWKNPRIPPN